MVEESQARFHAIIKGRVQGVNFRYFTMENAKNIRITGWVRNRRDGSVEVVAEGTRQNLVNFSNKLRNGPQSAVVTDFQLKWQIPTGEFSDFRVSPTA
jgi:acylphosphatase